MGPSDAEAIGGCHHDCVNPDHASETTLAQIARHREAQRDRSRCMRGHVLVDVGYYEHEYGGRVHRRCRLCWSMTQQRRTREYAAEITTRMSPERRATYERRAAATRRLWEEGVLRRKDGSLSPTAATPHEGVKQ